MNNGSLSNHPEDSDSQNQSASVSLGSEFHEALLKSLLAGFHATSILVCTQQGVVLFANSVAVKGFPGKDANSIIGLNLRDIAPEDWALERIEYLKLTAERDRQVLLIEILAGSRLSSTMSPVKLSRDGKPETVVLITVESVTPLKLKWLRANIDPSDIFDAQVVDLGRLSALTSRELEVLALMGEGLRQKQIAERLHRSVSTVDRHRERIGEKLGITDRIELVALAREAALEVSDAKRTNCSFGHEPFKLD